MNSKVILHCYPKSTKANNAGLLPIYIRITVDGKRLEFSTKKFIDPQKWSKEQSKMKGNSSESCSINSYLDVIKSKIVEIQMRLIHQKDPITFEVIKNEILGTQVRERTLIPIFQDHNNRIEALLGQEYAPGTLERYKTSLKHTQEFLQWKYNISDVELDKIDHALICDYEFYLRSVRKCANNSAIKYIKNFKKIVKQCMANGWITNDPFANYKSKVKEVERVFLTEQELNKIADKKFVSDRLNIVRDLFLFSCFTGLAYID